MTGGTTGAPALVDADYHGNDGEPAGRRRLILTRASSIRPRRVRWLWHERIALATLALLAGPEGLGKSTLAYWIAARVSRGDLPGEHHGTPKAILVCATEDSWAHTIIPRLMAAGADLNLVYRVDVVVDEALPGDLNLPRDLVELRRVAAETDAVLLVLDPLMSRLDATLDTHRDGEVRRALEPLVSTCEASGLSCLGLIHHNKSGSTDPLQLVMASKAFTAVARSVHTVIRDPADETGERRLFGTPKNNLGRADLPTMTFAINGWRYDTDDGPGWTGRLAWGEDAEGTIHDALARSARDPERHTAEKDAEAWLREYMKEHAVELTSFDGETGVDSVEVLAAAAANGHTNRTLHRAKGKLGITARKPTGPGTFTARWFWLLPHEDAKPD